MLTTAFLRDWGANVDEALVRCLNNETFYLTLVNKSLQDPSFEKLRTSCESGDLDKAFDAAHAIKGVMANLALTPILRPVQEITELLRSKTVMDYTPLVTEILSRRADLVNHG